MPTVLAIVQFAFAFLLLVGTLRRISAKATNGTEAAIGLLLIVTLVLSGISLLGGF